MIELEVTKTTCEHGASIFTAAPSEICLGGMDASGVDTLHVTVPDDWGDCVVRCTFIPHRRRPVAVLLDAAGCVQITRAITDRADRGVLVIDAAKDGYAAYTGDISWTAYRHSAAGGAAPADVQDVYAQMAVLVDDIKSAVGRVVRFDVSVPDNGDDPAVTCTATYAELHAMLTAGEPFVALCTMIPKPVTDDIGDGYEYHILNRYQYVFGGRTMWGSEDGQDLISFGFLSGSQSSIDAFSITVTPDNTCKYQIRLS